MKRALLLAIISVVSFMAAVAQPQPINYSVGNNSYLPDAIGAYRIQAYICGSDTKLTTIDEWELSGSLDASSTTLPVSDYFVWGITTRPAGGTFHTGKGNVVDTRMQVPSTTTLNYGFENNQPTFGTVIGSGDGVLYEAWVISSSYQNATVPMKYKFDGPIVLANSNTCLVSFVYTLAQLPAHVYVNNNVKWHEQ